MKYLVLSRLMTEDPKRRFVPTDTAHIMISITTPMQPSKNGSDLEKCQEANILENPSCNGILRLKFHDLDKDLGADFVLFDKKMAEQIINFVEQHKDTIELIVVHCDGGVSRSAAVAASLSKYYEGNDEWFFKNKHPNMLVYRILLNALNEHSKKES